MALVLFSLITIFWLIVQALIWSSHCWDCNLSAGIIWFWPGRSFGSCCFQMNDVHNITRGDLFIFMFFKDVYRDGFQFLFCSLKQIKRRIKTEWFHLNSFIFYSDVDYNLLKNVPIQTSIHSTKTTYFKPKMSILQLMSHL